MYERIIVDAHQENELRKQVQLSLPALKKDDHLQMKLGLDLV
jgi:hypothetical protein